jgi:hypothetical protein
MGPKSAAR